MKNNEERLHIDLDRIAELCQCGSLFYNLSKERDLIKSKTLNKSGVYIWFNKVTKKYYIGSSRNLYKRISRYFQSGYLNYKTQKKLADNTCFA